MLLSMRLSEISRAMPAGPVFAQVKDELALLSRLASSIEQELEVHRLRERHRIVAAEMDGTAAQSLAELVRDPDGVIVRPNFGRK
jgi:hypothetical protein